MLLILLLFLGAVFASPAPSDCKEPAVLKCRLRAQTSSTSAKALTNFTATNPENSIQSRTRDNAEQVVIVTQKVRKTVTASIHNECTQTDAVAATVTISKEGIFTAHVHETVIAALPDIIPMGTTTTENFSTVTISTGSASYILV
jgi:hypothetical protein